MKVSITISDDVTAPIEHTLEAVKLSIHHWRHYEGQWSPGAAIVYDSLGIATCTRKTDAGWAVKVYNLEK